MTGVKSYLESQMRYLNKQLSGYDLYSVSISYFTVIFYV